MSWVEQKYNNICSTHLRNFKWVKGNLARASCPICGDSKKKKNKARLYFFPHKETYIAKCHNCGIAWPLPMFLKQINPVLHDEYSKEAALESLSNTVVFKDKQYAIPKAIEIAKTVANPAVLAKLTKISSLPVNHRARMYVDSRKIPMRQHYRLFYVNNFTSWINEIIPDKYKESRSDPRLVLPLLDKRKTMFGAIGRSLTSDGMRYLTVMFDQAQPKIFGLDLVDLHKRFYIFEGPIDSLFFSNAIAMAGTSLADKALLDTTNAVYVFDNQPRNKQVIEQIEKVIDQGNKVCLWPQNVEQKDVNEMILAGATSLGVREQIDKNTFSGLEAKLNLARWRKI